MHELYVKCPECEEEHSPDAVQIVNIETDYIGRDLLSFVCPVTYNTTKAYVYSK